MSTGARRGGGVAALVVLAAVGLLLGQAVFTAHRGYPPGSSAPALDGLLVPAPGEQTREDPLRLLVLGDSTAAGLGASGADGTVAVGVAVDLAAATGRPVRLVSGAVSGARVADLAGQAATVGIGVASADVALVLVGANDATHLTRLGPLGQDLRAALTGLGAAGLPVVLGTCPDLGGETAFPRPLRWIVSARGRAVADREAEAARDVPGTVAVDLAALTGPAFRADPRRTLSADEFHPSDAGYALWTAALAPAVVGAVG